MSWTSLILLPRCGCADQCTVELPGANMHDCTIWKILLNHPLQYEIVPAAGIEATYTCARATS